MENGNPKSESVIVREVCGIYNAIKQNKKARRVFLYGSIILGVLILFWGYRCYRQNEMEKNAAALERLHRFNDEFNKQWEREQRRRDLTLETLLK